MKHNSFPLVPLCLIFVIGQHTALFGQVEPENLVFNPSFEEFVACPTGFGSLQSGFFEVSVTGLLGNLVFSSSGVIDHIPTCVWDGTGGTSGYLAADGYYHVDITVNGCEGISEDQTFGQFVYLSTAQQRLSDEDEDETDSPEQSNLSIEPESAKLKDDTLTTGVFVFPNPNSGSFTIAGIGMNQVVIMDAAGKLVRQLNAGMADRVSVDGLGAGLYIVQVQMADGRVENAKVIVN